MHSHKTLELKKPSNGLVFNAQEIEPALEGSAPLIEVTNPYLEPTITEETKTQEVAAYEETELATAHTFFEWIQLVEKGTYKQPKVARQKEEKLKSLWKPLKIGN